MVSGFKARLITSLTESIAGRIGQCLSSAEPIAGPEGRRASIAEPIAGRTAFWITLCLGAVGASLFPASASAYDFGRPIENITTEEDIYELYAVGDLSEEETERLVSLLQHKLDVNHARDEELFALPGVSLELARVITDRRDRNGLYKSLEELGSIPGMTPEILMQIAPFVQVRIPLKVPVTGSVKAKILWNRGTITGTLFNPDDAGAYGKSYTTSQLGLNSLPEGYVRVRSEVAERVKVGLVASSTEGLQSVEYSSSDEAFHGKWGRPLLQLNSAYALMDEPKWTAILGSYSVGFGQHLVFDETRRLQPEGLYPADEVFGSSSLSFPQRMLGVAATYRGLRIGPSGLELTGFFSRRRNDIYQYDFGTPNRIADDLSNQVYTRLTDDGQEVVARSLTLPNIYTEQIAGAHVTARLDKHTYVGLTGYWSHVYKDFPMVFKGEMPSDREGFGAIGLDFGAALWKVQLNGEYALMDNLSQAFFLRAIYDLGPGEILASFRNYGRNFDNPHSRGFSQPDQLTQERDRDETGFYLQGVYRFSRALTARGSYDIWYRPSLDVWRHSMGGRVNYSPFRRWDLGVFAKLTDKNLALSGRNQNYSGPTATTTTDSSGDGSELDGEEDPATTSSEALSSSSEGTGLRTYVGLQLTSSALRDFLFSVSYKRIYEDAAYRYYETNCSQPFGWQVGQDTWFKVRYAPIRSGFATARIRYLDEDVYGTKGSRAIEGYLQWSQRIKKGTQFNLRYSVARDLDGHPPTDLDNYCVNSLNPTGTTSSGTTTVPGTEHTFWASFETRF